MSMKKFIEEVEKRDIDVKFEALSFIENSTLLSKKNIKLTREFLKDFEFRPFLNLVFKSNDTNKEKIIMLSLTKEFIVSIIECNFFNDVFKPEYSLAKISDIVINGERLDGIYLPEILEKIKNFKNMIIQSINLEKKILYSRCLLENPILNKNISEDSPINITITSIVSKNNQNYFENIFTDELFSFDMQELKKYRKILSNEI